MIMIIIVIIMLYDDQHLNASSPCISYHFLYLPILQPSLKLNPSHPDWQYGEGEGRSQVSFLYFQLSDHKFLFNFTTIVNPDKSTIDKRLAECRAEGRYQEDIFTA